MGAITVTSEEGLYVVLIMPTSARTMPGTIKAVPT
jgi:hypothetical protein